MNNKNLWWLATRWGKGLQFCISLSIKIWNKICTRSTGFGRLALKNNTNLVSCINEDVIITAWAAIILHKKTSHMHNKLFPNFMFIFHDFYSFFLKQCFLLKINFKFVERLLFWTNDCHNFSVKTLQTI